MNCNNAQDNKPLNPYGDSELALLMRAMSDSMVSMKEQVKQGRLPDKFPEAFPENTYGKANRVDDEKCRV